MEMMLWIRLAIIVTALLMHHLPLKALPSTANNTTLPDITSTGFSFRLVTNNAIRRHDDGFQHLQPTSSLDPHPKTDTFFEPLQIPHHLVIKLGTDAGMRDYTLKVGREHDLTWIQCFPCVPKALQRDSLFTCDLSPTCHHIPSTSCGPPYSPSNQKCAFRLTGSRGLLVTGFLEEDTFVETETSSVIQNFIFGCSHSTHNFNNEGIYAGVVSLGRNPPSLVMQVAGRGLTQFSYCLVGGTTKRVGYLRFGSDIPHNPRYRTTRILQHESEYHLSLVGISLGGQKLDGIRPEMFARSSKDETGGCVIDISTPLTVVAQEAYNIIEEALWSDLQQHERVERVKRHGFGLCFRATEYVKGGFKSLSLHFSDDKAVLVLSPKQLFLMMHDNKEGQVACLAMKPGNRSVIGAFQQVDTRFVYDVKESKLSFASESCTLDTVEVD